VGLNAPIPPLGKRGLHRVLFFSCKNYNLKQKEKTVSQPPLLKRGNGGVQTHETKKKPRCQSNGVER